MILSKTEGTEMHVKKILFPTDFSTIADQALDYAATLAKENGAKLLIVHIAELPAAYGAGEMYYGIPEPDTDELLRMLHNVVPRNPPVDHEYRLLKGDPAREIVRVAKDDTVDLIVMSTHGRTGLGRVLMGSIAEAVVRRAHCPVLTLKGTVAVPQKTATA
jgi:nucleotide-binding universal stress UspA family protein